MGMEDLSVDITYDPCQFSLDSTFNGMSNFMFLCVLSVQVLPHNYILFIQTSFHFMDFFLALVLSHQGVVSSINSFIQLDPFIYDSCHTCTVRYCKILNCVCYRFFSCLQGHFRVLSYSIMLSWSQQLFYAGNFRFFIKTKQFQNIKFRSNVEIGIDGGQLFKTVPYLNQLNFW